MRAMIGPINYSLRFGWVGANLSVVPANAGPRLGRYFFRKASASVLEPRHRAVWVPAFAGTTWTLIQIDIEFVGAVAADQRQFKRSTFGVRARRQAV